VGETITLFFRVMVTWTDSAKDLSAEGLSRFKVGSGCTVLVAIAYIDLPLSLIRLSFVKLWGPFALSTMGWTRLST
jgi:hypothetical protein